MTSWWLYHKSLIFKVMNKFISLAAALTAFAALTSCNEAAKLASDTEGSWSGAPERFTVSDSAMATMTPIYTFVLGENDKDGGTVTVSALISATMPYTPTTPEVVLPFSITASAIGTIEGTWKVVDDDDIAFNFNFDSVNVNVNPDNITLSDNALDDQTQSNWEQFKPSYIKSLEAGFSDAMRMRFMAVRGLEDVEIKNDVMEYEFNDVKMYMHRDGNMSDVK